MRIPATAPADAEGFKNAEGLTHTKLSQKLEEVSTLLDGYSQPILNSES